MIYYNYYQASSQQGGDKTRYEFKELNSVPLSQELIEITHALNTFFENNDYGDLTIDLYSETHPVIFSSFQAYLDNHDLLIEKNLNWTHEDTSAYIEIPRKRNDMNQKLLTLVIEELKRYPHVIAF